MATSAQFSTSITQEGRARLEAELEHLVTVRRPEVLAVLCNVRDDGADSGENPGLIVALQEQAAVEGRIQEMQAALASASVADPPADDVVDFGQHVMLQVGVTASPVRYQLVGALESDPARGRLSIDSPIGSALLGRRAGDSVEVETPGGERRVTVVAVGDPGSPGRRTVPPAADDRRDSSGATA